MERVAVSWRVLPLALAGLLALSGCQKRENQVTFDGYAFRSNAAAVDRKKSLKEFTVSVRDFAKAPEAALQAGAYEGTKYCIRNYGTSRIDWQISPRAPVEEAKVVGGVLVLRGACNPL